MEALQEILQARQAASSGDSPPNVEVFRGKYSPSCSAPVTIYRRALRNLKSRAWVHCMDALRLLRERRGVCDLIITDPPYGLNTEIPPDALAELYEKVIDAMILALSAQGQLVLALPDWSHIGRQVPFFTTRKFITQQILAAAQRRGREVIQTAYAFPSPIGAFRPPYYWESDRALRRAIIHFRFKQLE